jgi:hypothetical protein
MPVLFYIYSLMYGYDIKPFRLSVVIFFGPVCRLSLIFCMFVIVVSCAILNGHFYRSLKLICVCYSDLIQTKSSLQFAVYRRTVRLHFNPIQKVQFTVRKT